MSLVCELLVLRQQKGNESRRFPLYQGSRPCIQGRSLIRNSGHAEAPTGLTSTRIAADEGGSMPGPEPSGPSSQDFTEGPASHFERKTALSGGLFKPHLPTCKGPPDYSAGKTALGVAPIKGFRPNILLFEKRPTPEWQGVDI